MGSDQLFKKNKIRNASALARNKAKKSPYATLYIVCEDSKSSPLYFKKMIEHLRLNTANIYVVSGKGSAPISVVEHALALAQKTPDIDYIFCVFDSDNHESYRRAIDRLENFKSRPKDKSKPQFKAVTSTPCYEIWLLLHFCYTTKNYGSADILIKDLIKYLTSYKKNTTDWFDVLIDKIETAIKNAKLLQEYNKSTNTINPSTKMHELIKFMKELKN